MPRASASSWPHASRSSRVSCRDCPECRNCGDDRGHGPGEDSLLCTPFSSPCWMATNRLRSPAEGSPMAHPIIAFIGVPYDGAATLGWPGARYAPAEVRRHLTWMLNRVQGGQIYWVDEDRIVPFHLRQLHDGGDVAVSRGRTGQNGSRRPSRSVRSGR